MSIIDMIKGTVEAVEEAVEYVASEMRGRRRGAAQVQEDGAPNAGVFDDYDMVVSIPRRVINAQLAQLQASGAIPPRMILTQMTDAEGNFTYQALQSSDQIPRDAAGNPTVACIDAAVRPRIDIPASGQLVTLVLEFLSGSVWFVEDAGPLAKPTRYDATGWTYGIAVTLDLAAVAEADIQNGAVPSNVQAQLGAFMDAMFQVDHLFLDLDSANLLRFDPTTTDLQGVDPAAVPEFALFMQFYLDNLKAGGNPFILGYTATTTAQTQVPSAQNVPPQLLPTGTTFTLYQDPTDPDLSTVNYVLVTQGGHGTISGSPPNLTSNWITPGDQCDAKAIYSHACLAEPLLVQPVFEQVRQGVYQQISQNVSVGEGNDYGAARQPTADGWHFDISSVTDGEDQYSNALDVACAGAQLTFSGNVSAYKHVSKNDFFCTAYASAQGAASWGGTITLGAAAGALTAVGSFATTSSTSQSYENDCAKAFGWIGAILGGVLDVFTGWADGGFFSNLFAGAFSVSVPGIGDLNVVLGNLSTSASSVVVLPAGGVFEFTAPDIDAAGNVSLDLTYRQP